MSAEEEYTGTSVSGSGTGKEIDETSWPGSHLPGYLAYLSLLFKLITTLMTVLMASWVITTIKRVRSLHKPHNIFVANLMVADIMTTLLFCFISSMMNIAYAFGVGEYISCNLIRLPFSSANVIYCSFLVVSIDTVTAIAFPLKYKQLMTHSIIRYTIIAEWIMALIPLVPLLFHTTTDFINVAEYGTCVAADALIEIFFTTAIPGIITTLFSIFLNIYTAIKAYQAYKKIEAENKLSGNSGQSATSDAIKQNRHKFKRKIKPIITMLVIASGGIVYSLVIIILFFLGRLYISSISYHDFMDLILIPNSYFAIPLLHPFVYGLYFKQIRKPMLRSLKGLCCKCNSSAVAPQLPKIAWM